MPPRLPLRPAGQLGSMTQRTVSIRRQPVCFFCSISSRPSLPSTRRTRRKPIVVPRFESTVATKTPSDPRKELEDVLLELQKYAENEVNLSRLQLALNGLRQRPGNESIRVAVLGLSNGSESSATAKQVLRLLFADPLKDVEPWEHEVEEHDLSQPMIIRIGAEEQQKDGAISITRGSSLHEVNVSSATLNGHNIELLLMEASPFMSSQESGALEGFEDSVLVPTVDIPTSSEGKYTPITTPVHKALLVTDGIMGAASVVAMPSLESPSVLASAVNLPGYKPAQSSSPLPFTPIDIGTATVGLGLVRKDLRNAIEFEHLWFQSNLPKLTEWLKADVLTTPDNTTKPPLKELISSILRNTSAALGAKEARRVGTSLFSTTSATPLETLHAGLDEWAERAHTELQDQLDLAFAGRRWRKLGWWKLFWRVDDVGMLTNDILAQKFLPGAERSAIFLAGRMKEAGVPVVALPLSLSDNGTTVQPDEKAQTMQIAPDWPINIPATRYYLQATTVPELQSLAQKLVLQTLSTSSLTTALGALVYLSTLTTTLYEAGAVAALGIVWSMRRMQKHWETAREFWEGEVREEGRKAVRGVEGVIRNSLKESQVRGEGGDLTGQANTSNAKELVQRAKELLAKLK
ncbi:hypothetical protein F5Y15DRAFT_255328 [Xylariaceae sp. FL0016]|nr:hypothetical protein F5Y15DRAFT_255328 [Xylariaceae sp. FL0016]